MTAPQLHTCLAIVAVAAVEITALVTGHNGTTLRLALIAIAGLGGFAVAQLVSAWKKDK